MRGVERHQEGVDKQAPLPVRYPYIKREHEDSEDSENENGLEH